MPRNAFVSASGARSTPRSRSRHGCRARTPPAESESRDRGTVLVRDLERRDLVYVCRPDAGELVVITLFEQGDDAAVPKRFTDALRRDDHRVA